MFSLLKIVAIRILAYDINLASQKIEGEVYRNYEFTPLNLFIYQNMVI